MAKQNLSSIWESNLQVKDDYSSDVDGVNILARVSGPSFFPDTMSRNNVFYPRKAWENAINYPEFKQKLKDRRIYGTIGHDIETLDDSQVREGNFSHIVTKVWIDENGVGNAEYLVLNTPPGRILNTILRAKSKIFVSTKAAGEFKSIHEDTKSVDPDIFFLERIDFVIDPGYLKANPQLLESFNKSLKKDAKMTNVIGKKPLLEQYKALGSPEEITKCLEALQKYIELGSVNSIKESLKKSTTKISQLTKIIENKFSDVAEALTKENMKTLLEQYKELGTPSEIKKLVKIACSQHKSLMEAKARRLAKKYGVKESFIRRQYNKGMSMTHIEEMLRELKGVKKGRRRFYEDGVEVDDTVNVSDMVDEVSEDDEELPSADEIDVNLDEDDDEVSVEVDEPIEEDDETGFDDEGADVEIDVNEDDEEEPVDIDISLDEIPSPDEVEECGAIPQKRVGESRLSAIRKMRKISSSRLAKIRRGRRIAESKKPSLTFSGSLVSKLMK